MGRVLRAALLPGLLLLAAGCDSRPTYPKERLTQSLETLLADDGLKASVHFVDHTLGVQLFYPTVLEQSEVHIGIGPGFEDAARRVLTTIHRVLLSSDAEVNFYVLVFSDPEVPGAHLTLVRYLDDIKRANANMIDSPEMFARTIYELNYAGASPVTIETYVPRDIRLEEFLSWQLARRVQTALTEELRVSGVADVGRCGGRFQNGEFVFTLDVSPVAGGTALDEATVRQMFEVSTNVIAKVLSSYRFESFNAVRLIHPVTGRHFVLPRTRLDVFR